MAIITISRGTLRGAQALAECAAARLGYRCISRELVINAMEWYGEPMDVPREPEDQLSSLRSSLGGVPASYIDSFRAELCEYARGGNLVYHGYVGHLTLPNVPVLRVRVVADMECRIDAAVRERGMTREAAATYIERADRERREWIRYLYGVEWDDITLYDVVFNLCHLSLDSACSTLVHMAQFDEFKQTPDSLKVIENLALGGRVSRMLSWDPQVGNAALKVAVDDGVVTIAGTASKEVANALPLIVSKVGGVRKVESKVVIP